MAIKVIVFDFDGTLVDSNQIKYDAFFELFPHDNSRKKIIKEVIKEYREEPRSVIIKKILERSSDRDAKKDDIVGKVKLLSDRYNKIVIERVKHCKTKTGALKALKVLSGKYRLYLSSITPEISLKEIVRYRKWDPFFCKIFGYPKNKISSLLNIVRRESIYANEILVVGDGMSDMDSAKIAGCKFFPVCEEDSLEKLIRVM